MWHARRILNNVRMQHTWIKPEGYDTGINVYNCIAKKKVPFVVRDRNNTTWYTCGPTVYDSAHIGHASCYVKLDVIQRILRNHFKVNLVTAMNITDIDDKIIKKSIQTQTSPIEIARYYEKEFWDDLESLKIIKPDLILRVTENIGTIEKFIGKLINSKHAYKTDDGSVIFDLKVSKNYGKLLNIVQKASTEISDNPKVNFTLWKAAKENEPYWDTVYGPGRPGWHTECSAIASAVFGSCIDVHAGGIDLRFPHHENEEVQCCEYFSKSQWINYWLHTGHLLQDSTKMSKSLNNTVSIRQLLQMCSADVFRVMCLMSHYTYNVDFSDEYVNSAAKLLDMYNHFVANCNAFISGKIKVGINKDVLYTHLIESINNVNNALSDDFDTASCIKTINSLITTTNKMLHSSAATECIDLSSVASLVNVLNFVVSTFNLFGIDLKKQVTSLSSTQADTTELINILVEFREKVRAVGIASKNPDLLQFCDKARNDLNKCGIIVKDHGKQSSWSK